MRHRFRDFGVRIFAGRATYSDERLDTNDSRKYNNTATTLPNDSTPATDESDYDAWPAQFGQAAGSGSGAGADATVPESATLVMCIMAMLTYCSRRVLRNHNSSTLTRAKKKDDPLVHPADCGRRVRQL